MAQTNFSFRNDTDKPMGNNSNYYEPGTVSGVKDFAVNKRDKK